MQQCSKYAGILVFEYVRSGESAAIKMIWRTEMIPFHSWFWKFHFMHFNCDHC